MTRRHFLQALMLLLASVALPGRARRTTVRLSWTTKDGQAHRRDYRA